MLPGISETADSGTSWRFVCALLQTDRHLFALAEWQHVSLSRLLFPQEGAEELVVSDLN